MTHSNSIHTLALLLCALGQVCASGAEITLVEKGKPQSAIVVGPNPPMSVVYAAKELHTYILKMSGASLPIIDEPTDGPLPAECSSAVHLGATSRARAHNVDADELSYDGFRIAMPADGVLIVKGRDYRGPPLPGRRGRVRRNCTPDKVIRRFGETGTLYGVYRLLNDLGVRWFLPGEIGEVVPSHPTVRLEDYTVLDAPHFHCRNLYAFWFDKDPEAARWWKRIGYGSHRYVNLNHSFTHWARHYGNEHADWFATVNGRRDVYNNKPPGREIINFTHPAVLEKTAEEAIAFFQCPPWHGVKAEDRSPYAEFFPLYPVVPNDSFVKAGKEAREQGWITPERGRAGEFSDYVWHFVNEVAKRVKKRCPDRMIGSLAYSHQFLPPTRIDRLEDNIVVMVCKRRLWYWDAELRQRDREAIRTWKALGAKRIYVWEYYNIRGQKALYRGVPTVAPHLIADDLGFLKDYSSGEFIEAEPEDPKRGWNHTLTHVGLSHLNLYVNAKLLWNPDRDVDTLLADYYDKYYGPAHDVMARFYGDLEATWTTPERHSDRPWQTLFPPEDINKLFGYLIKAERLTEGTEFAERVAFIKAEFEEMKAQSALASKWAAPPELYVPLTRGGPTIDGVLDDGVWKRLGNTILPLVDNGTGEADEDAPQLDDLPRLANVDALDAPSPDRGNRGAGR